MSSQSTHAVDHVVAAPEVIRGEEYNEKADIYSFGIILWCVLANAYIGTVDAQPQLTFWRRPHHRELLTRAVPYGDQTFLHVVTEVLQVSKRTCWWLCLCLQCLMLVVCRACGQRFRPRQTRSWRSLSPSAGTTTPRNGPSSPTSSATLPLLSMSLQRRKRSSLLFKI